MSSEVKVWSVSVAARYREGVLLEEFDNSYSSDMRPFMVSVEDFNALSSKLGGSLAVLRRLVEGETCMCDQYHGTEPHNSECIITAAQEALK